MPLIRYRGPASVLDGVEHAAGKLFEYSKETIDVLIRHGHQVDLVDKVPKGESPVNTGPDVPPSPANEVYVIGHRDLMRKDAI